MNTRLALPRPGRCGWALQSTFHPLPAGLPERSPVLILAVNRNHVTAKDAAGHVWQLECGQVDGGRFCRTPGGGWIHESKARARAIICEQLQRHLASPRPSGEAGQRWDETASQLYWIVQRNRGNASAGNS